MKIFLKYPILFLFTLIPFGYLVSYTIEKIGFTSISSYFFLFTTIFLFYNIKTPFKFIFGFILVSYFLIYVFYFSGKLSANARELIPFVLHVTAFFSIKYINKSINQLTPDIVFNFFKYFSIIFTLLFLITAFFEGKSVYDTIDNVQRVYYDGFVISHQFSYFAILLSILLFKFRYFKLSLVLVVLALLVGNRIAFILLFFAILLYVENNNDNIAVFVFKKMTKFTLLVVFFLILYFISEFNTSISYINNILLDVNNIKFTSGRSLFWANGFFELNKNTIFGFNHFFGMGPDSVEILAKKIYGQYYWMHNDFMQIFYCYGLFGFLIYILSLFYLYKVTNSLASVFLVFSLAFLNGFYTYGSLQLLIMMQMISSYSISYPFNISRKIYFS